jgi:hypothetical protein
MLQPLGGARSNAPASHASIEGRCADPAYHELEAYYPRAGQILGLPHARAVHVAAGANAPADVGNSMRRPVRHGAADAPPSRLWARYGRCALRGSLYRSQRSGRSPKVRVVLTREASPRFGLNADGYAPLAAARGRDPGRPPASLVPRATTYVARPCGGLIEKRPGCCSCRATSHAQGIGNAHDLRGRLLHGFIRARW